MAALVEDDAGDQRRGLMRAQLDGTRRKRKEIMDVIRRGIIIIIEDDDEAHDQVQS